MTEPDLQHSGKQQTDTHNDEPSALREICTKLHSQVTAFLQKDVETERLKAVQAQTRRSLAVIQEALDKYEYVIQPPHTLSTPNSTNC